MICQHSWFRQQLQLTACSTVGRRDNFANSSANSNTITVGYDPVNLRIANSKTPDNCVPQTSVGSHTKCWQLCFIRWREFVGLYIWRGYTDVNPSKETKCWQGEHGNICYLRKVLAEPSDDLLLMLRMRGSGHYHCFWCGESHSSMMTMRIFRKWWFFHDGIATIGQTRTSCKPTRNKYRRESCFGSQPTPSWKIAPKAGISATCQWSRPHNPSKQDLSLLFCI